MPFVWPPDNFATAADNVGKYRAIAEQLAANSDNLTTALDTMNLSQNPPGHDEAAAMIAKANAIDQKAQAAAAIAIAARIGSAGNFDRLHSATDQLKNDMDALDQTRENIAAFLAIGTRVLTAFTAFSTGTIDDMVGAITGGG